MFEQPVTAVYAGSFDPVTLGHEDLIRRAAGMFHQVIVAIGVNSSKKPTFTTEERLSFLNDVAMQLPNVRIMSFQGLLVNFCKDQGAKVIVRGLRTLTDFEYELSIAQANAMQAPGVETIFLPTMPSFSNVSSSMVRDFARHGGNLKPYVNDIVAKALRERIRSTT